ncbi:hypothetical protein SLA2020_154900 [Shorea laevis]
MGKEDKRGWRFDKDGLNTSKKAYVLMFPNQKILDADFIKAIWNKFLQENNLFFACGMFLDRLPTEKNLERRGIRVKGGNLNCPPWNQEEDELNRVTLQCSFSYQVWTKIFAWWELQTVLPGSLRTAFRQRMQGFTNEKQRVVWSFLFIITSCKVLTKGIHDLI